MRRFYQDSWQGIPFASFARVSYFRLPDPAFYEAFYDALFRRYGSPEGLPEAWRGNKRMDAMLLAERLRRRDGKDGMRVLSVGCGLGFMEKVLLEEVPGLELHVNETGAASLRWIRGFLPDGRVHVGLAPGCLPAGVDFDMIYLSTMDYGIRTGDMTRLLQGLRDRLAPGGELVCLSASWLEADTLPGRVASFVKDVLRGCLHCLGLHRRQFWGWRRTAEEYRRLFRDAGFEGILDGRLEGGHDRYWIRGV